MSQFPMYRTCPRCGSVFSYNPSVGDFGKCTVCALKSARKQYTQAYRERTKEMDYNDENRSKLEELRRTIENSDLSEKDKAQLLQNIMQIENQKINLLITGATGCGKSSTINALFGTEVAKVGCTPDPETMEIERYDLDNLILWDSPGLGDGKEADNRHAKNIIKNLTRGIPTEICL